MACGAGLSLRLLRAAMAVVVMGTGLAHAQFLVEGDLGADPDVTTLRALISGDYRLPDVRQARLAAEAALPETTRRAAIAPEDWDLQDEKAVQLFRVARVEQAITAWKEILDRQPTRLRTLLNLVTALHRTGRRDQALEYLEKARKLAPGYRSGLLDLQKSMIEFQQLQSYKPDWGSRHLLTDELTELWNKRGNPPKTFPDNTKLKSVSVAGLVELVRRQPEFGDGWVALGVALEVQNDIYYAVRCYEQGIKRGTGQRAAVEAHLRLLAPAARAADPARQFGWRAVWSILALFIIGGLAWAWRTARAVVDDVKEARNDPDRKKPGVGPLGSKPLD